MRLSLALPALILALSSAPSPAADKPPATQPATTRPAAQPPLKPTRKHNLPSWVKAIDSLNLPPDTRAQADKIFDEYDRQEEAFLQTHGKEQNALYAENFAARKANDLPTAARTSKRLIELGKLHTAPLLNVLKQLALLLNQEQYARFRASGKLQYCLPWPMALDLLNLPATQNAQVARIFQDLEEQTTAREEKDAIEYAALTARCLHAQSVNDYAAMNQANQLAAWLASQQINRRMEARTRLTRALTPAQLTRFDILTTCPRGIFTKKSDSYVWGAQRADFNADQTTSCHAAMLRLAASIDKFQTPPDDNQSTIITEALREEARKTVDEDIFQSLVPFTDLERMDLICAKPPGGYFAYTNVLDLQPYQLESMRSSIARMDSRFNAAATDIEKSLIIEAALRHTFAILTYSQRYYIIRHMYSTQRLNPTRFADNR
jgi:hypothetical protein